MSKRSKKKEKRERGAAARRRAEEHTSGFEPTAIICPEGTERFKEKVTRKPYRLDIIPFRMKEDGLYADKGEVYYEKTFWVHWLGEDIGSYICAAKQIGRKCPICDYRAKLTKDVDADEDLIKSLSPRERQLFRVIDLKEKDKGIQLWEISFHNFGKQLDDRISSSDEEDKYREFYELENGFTLKVGFTENSFGGTKFPKTSSIDFKARDEDYDEEIIEQGPDLDECVKIFEYDELKKIFLQTTDDDEDSGTTKKTKKKSKKKEKEPESESDDWDKGDRVIVEIEGDYYAGEITGIDDELEDDVAIVKFDDGDVQEVAIDDLKVEVGVKVEEEDDLLFEVGDRVVVEIDGEDYAGKITEVDGDKETASIKFDDGDSGVHDFNEFKPEPESGKFEKGKGKDKKNKCPHGHVFGKDNDAHKDCVDCDMWDDCDDAAQKEKD